MPLIFADVAGSGPWIGWESIGGFLLFALFALIVLLNFLVRLFRADPPLQVREFDPECENGE